MENTQIADREGQGKYGKFLPMLEALVIVSYVGMIVAVIYLGFRLEKTKADIVKINENFSIFGNQLNRISKGEVPVIVVDGKGYAVIPAMAQILGIEAKIREAVSGKVEAPSPSPSPTPTPKK